MRFLDLTDEDVLELFPPLVYIPAAHLRGHSI
jgi:hypothetical protein